MANSSIMLEAMELWQGLAARSLTAGFLYHAEVLKGGVTHCMDVIPVSKVL